ncbi:unnamed protein product, partial [Amoebophrya sp. A25]|eukprot:GSA25T00021389001.1
MEISFPKLGECGGVDLGIARHLVSRVVENDHNRGTYIHLRRGYFQKRQSFFYLLDGMMNYSFKTHKELTTRGPDKMNNVKRTFCFLLAISLLYSCCTFILYCCFQPSRPLKMKKPQQADA